MSVIEFMTGEQLGTAVEVANQAVSGMTYAEAAAALGGSTIGSSGATQIWTFPLSGGNSWKPVTVEAQYAAQTWEYYKTAAEAAGITSFGAAAMAAKTWAQGVIMGTGEGLAATGGLLTLSAPTAVAAAAPLLGVGIGASLYNMNPELWTKISQAILPWCYGDTFTIPAVVDEDGQVSIPKGLVDALKDLFDEEGIGPSGEYASNLNGTYVYASAGDYVEHYDTYTMTRYADLWVHISATGSCQLFTSPGQHIIRTDVYNDGRVIDYTDYANVEVKDSNGNSTGYWRVGTTVPVPGTPPTVLLPWSTTLMHYFDGVISPVGGGFPEGTSEWSGAVPSTLPEIPVVVTPGTGSEPGVTVPYTPVHLPEVQTPVSPNEYPAPSEDPDIIYPWISPDPSETPDPQAPNELPEITPYIFPEIPWQWPWELDEPEPVIDPDTGESTEPTKAPYDDPTQKPGPEIDPERDPQEEPAPLPQPAPSPWGDDIPPSDGQTPDPGFPVIDITPFPDLPMSDVSGLIHVYNPTPAEMQAFGRWLWVTIQDAITQGQELIWNNPFDGVISAHELYATPTTGAAQYIRSGFLTSDVSSAVVSARYNSINCGSVVIPEYWRNYLDYSPYTRVYCYLPFIGIVELDCDDIIGHAVNILYHVDSYSGACIAQITVAKDGPDGETYCNTVYQFSGNCSVEVPIAGGTQAAIRAAQMNAAAWGIGSVVSGIAQALTSPTIGGAVGGIIGGITGAMQARASVVSAKSSVQHSGSFGANFGAMGIKTPYLIVRRPIQKVVDNYNQDYGFPAHKMVQIGTCDGYLRVREVNVISATANDTEKRMIEQMLKEGVYVS